jgi:outer membrane protein assembly factor BamB
MALAVIFAAVAVASAEAADWPRWRGSSLDGCCAERGLLQQWPDQGPALLWNIEGAGKGFSSLAIVGDSLFTMGDVAADSGSKEQQVICFELSSRQKRWSAKVGPPHEDGPRCTPTVDQDRVYALGTEGDLVCLLAATGQEVWRQNLKRDFAGKMMSDWKFSESPLVDRDKLVVTPGGAETVLVALDKKTGGLLWKSSLPSLGNRGNDGAGYSSAVIAEAGGIRQYVQLMGRGCIGVGAKDGRF